MCWWERRLEKSIVYLFKRRSTVDLIPILNQVNRPLKELSEAMALFWYLYDNMREPTVLVDLCSGKIPLLSIVSLLNLRSIRKAIAVDVLEPHPVISGIDRLVYMRKSIFDEDIVDVIIENLGDKEYNVIITGIHCCKKLSTRTIEITKQLANKIEKFHGSLIVPCCVDSKTIKNTLGYDCGTYECWIKTLKKHASQHGLNVSTCRAKSMLSDKNVVIIIKDNKS